MDSERPDEKEGQPKAGNGSSQTPAGKDDIKSLLRAASGVPAGGKKAVAVDPSTPEGRRAAASGVGLIERTKEQGQALKERAVEEAKTYKDPQQTQLWKSIFRVSHDRSDPRNRSLAILSNVFLHLHPAKINRDAVRYGFTWGMGGITFYLFIVLTFTGVLLMFYYHPTKVQAFRDILYLEHDVPFGKLLRNMHRWAAHL
ncbi:MAG TPA: hypothetical protein VGO96_21765, partial [Pyrinomonadaceae bacterium]|nr:hypothetical protein [Pyrinomonadaceae bacterium]